MRVSRRVLLSSSLAAVPVLATARVLRFGGDPGARLAALERRHGGRLGVTMFNTGSGARLQFRAHERFALCSTFKALLVAQVLSAVDAGREQLGRRLRWRADELISWSPVVEKGDAATGLTIAELCAAAITVSDNTAANLLLAAHGGPAALTRWLRDLGDMDTRLDRNEPALNQVGHGDARDTTTPAAMVATLQKILLGEVLSEVSREQLLAWLAGNTTGDRRLRAGLPGWKVGDKTGTNNTGNVNDVAIAWPPGGGSPLLIAAYYAEAQAAPEQREAVLAEVGTIAAAWAAG